MRDNSHILAAHEKLRSEARKTPTAGDSRYGSTHDRHNRSFVRVPYRDVEIMFYPIKRWPAFLATSIVTLRLWLKRRVISSYVMHHMPVMCRAELVALNKVIVEWREKHSIHHEIDKEFIDRAHTTLAATRIALDAFKRGHSLTPDQQQRINPSLQEGSNAPAFCP